MTLPHRPLFCRSAATSMDPSYCLPTYLTSHGPVAGGETEGEGHDPVFPFGAGELTPRRASPSSTEKFE